MLGMWMCIVNILALSLGILFCFYKALPLKLPRSCKLKPLWVGLYRIVRASGDNAYELEPSAKLA